MDFAQFVNHFIALLVVANPLSALPAVLRITRNQTIQEKKQTGLTTAFAVGAILFVSTWIGTPLLNLLGIKLPAFQVAGGFVVFMMALSMLNAEESPLKQSTEEQRVKRGESSGAIVPLAIPIIAGPGAISTVIVSVNEFQGFWNHVVISISTLLVAAVMALLLYFAANLEKLIGHGGINIINRLGGLVLAAISIQIISNGLLALFPGLGK